MRAGALHRCWPLGQAGQMAAAAAGPAGCCAYKGRQMEAAASAWKERHEEHMVPACMACACARCRPAAAPKSATQAAAVTRQQCRCIAAAPNLQKLAACCHHKMRLHIHPPLAITPTSHAGAPAAPPQAPILQECRAGAAGGSAGTRQGPTRTTGGYTARQAIHRVPEALQSDLH